MSVVLVLMLLFTAIIVPERSYGIIFLPALILIPIAKILAVLLAGFSIPALGVGALWSKMTKKSIWHGIGYAVVALLLIAVIVGIVLKVIHPDRPLF